MPSDYTGGGRKAAKDSLADDAGAHHAEEAELSLDIMAASSAPAGHGFPLSYMQEQLWLVARMNPDLPIDNFVWFIDTPRSLDVVALKRSIQELVQRHEALRSTFLFEQGQPIQLVTPAAELELPIVSVEALPSDAQESEVRRLAEAALRRPFDLERGPLFRAFLVRLSGGLHKLIFITHHIIIDAFSAYRIFFSELISLYDACVSGAGLPHRPPIPQIRHYALWQRRRARDEAFAEHMRYWKGQLETFPEVPHLPTDHPRPVLPSARAAERSHLISNAIIDAVGVLGRDERATLFTVLLTTLFVLIYRYTDQEDIPVGTFIADRNSRAKQAIFGPLINTVVLRANLRENMTFRQALRHVREVLAAARDHSELPFEMLVNELRPRRTPGQPPFFQVAFNYLTSVTSAEWSITHRGAITGATNIDLSFDLQSTPEGIRIYAQHRTDLYDSITVERMLKHYELLLCGAVRNADDHIWALPLLSDDEQRLIAAWNETAASVSEDPCVARIKEDQAEPSPSTDAAITQGPRASGETEEGAILSTLFERQVERTPDATALIFGEEEVTYRELNIRANRLAHRMRALGIGPETTVCILLTRSTEMLVAMLGVLKAGGAYLPMDPAFPRARLSFLLEDARPSLVITQRNLLALLPPAAPVLALDSHRAVIAEESEENPEVDIRPENAAYIIYTSGSTGKPKGVVIEHRNATAFLSSIAGSFSPQELAFVLGAASICFDLSIFELFLPLCRGGAIIIARNVLALSEVPAHERVTLLSAVPSAMTVLLDTCGLPPSVETVILAGEPLHPQLAERVLELGHVRRLYNIYGPTECTTYVTIAAVRAGETPTIGRAIANTRLYVMNAHGSQEPVGVPGELYIGGAGVSRGYLSRPELTAERFVPDPFGTGERVYKTGDLVRFMADGSLAFMGRIDNQVKLRGFRIELGEVEATLIGHPLVREVAVLKVEDAPGDGRLVAYVAPDPSANRETLVEALRTHTRSQLPGYMVPASFVIMDALPKGTSGKIDRRALPLERRQPELGAEHVEPKEEMEILIADIWKRVLHLKDVGVHDNFFDLGGNSLLLVHVHEALCKSVPIPLTMLQLLASPTIRSLAQTLLSESREGDTSLTRAQDRARKQKLALEGQRQRVPLKTRKQ